MGGERETRVRREGEGERKKEERVKMKNVFDGRENKISISIWSGVTAVGAFSACLKGVLTESKLT